MGIFSSTRRQRLRLVPPDYTERRDGQALLVWGGIPHWMVVDDEMHALLQGLDGSTALGDAVGKAVAARAERAAALQACEALAQTGVLIDPDAPSPPARTQPEPRIENIALNLTNRCNLGCSFCYNQDHAGKREDELTAGEAIRFLDDARPFASPGPSLTILGGEPLLEEGRLLQVCAHAAKLGMVSIVSTNGTRVTAGFAREARRIGLQVQVSLDGHTAELNDPIRGRGAYAKALTGVRTLVEHGAFTILSMVVHRGNLPFLADYLDLARKLGVNEARFIPLKQLGGATTSGLIAVPLPELLAESIALLRRRPAYASLLGRDALSILANTCRYGARRSSCGTGLQTILLDADGGLYPCLNTVCPELRIASVRDTGYAFERVWRTSEVLRRVRECSDVDSPGRFCAGCPVRHWCLGGCRGETLAATGDLSAPAPNCLELRRAVLDMMWFLTESPKLVRVASVIC